jgi:hypothetical protein
VGLKGLGCGGTRSPLVVPPYKRKRIGDTSLAIASLNSAPHFYGVYCNNFNVAWYLKVWDVVAHNLHWMCHLIDAKELVAQVWLITSLTSAPHFYGVYCNNFYVAWDLKVWDVVAHDLHWMCHFIDTKELVAQVWL